MKLDRFQYSKALAAVRDSDYAHPGEEESIDILLEHFPDTQNINILDFGCGLGGTLNYIYNRGYQNITGLDINEESIQFALKKYSKKRFYSELNQIDDYFNLVYAINVFYLIENKNNLFMDIRNKTMDNALLMLSDFSYKDGSIPDKLKEYIPHAFDFKDPLKNPESLWGIQSKIDLSANYAKWYTLFVNKIKKKKNHLIDNFGTIYFDYMLKKYSFLLESIQKQTIGGILLILKKNNFL